MAGPKVRLVLRAMEREICGKAFPGADGLQSPEWPRDPFHVLIATVLSQRTKDMNTYKAAKQLFARFDGPRDIAEADVKEVEMLIRPSGFYQVKAKGDPGDLPYLGGAAWWRGARGHGHASGLALGGSQDRQLRACLRIRKGRAVRGYPCPSDMQPSGLGAHQTCGRDGNGA